VAPAILQSLRSERDAAIRDVRTVNNRAQVLQMQNDALLARCTALERDLQAARDSSFELDEARSSIAELKLQSDELDAHRMRADSMQVLARQLTDQLDQQRRAQQLASIDSRSESAWQERAIVEQAAQSVAQMRSEVREARAFAERAVAQRDAAGQRVLALEGELEKQRNALSVARQFAPPPVESMPAAAAAAASSSSVADDIVDTLHRQHWFRGFTAHYAEWRLADIALEPNDLILQRQVVTQLRAALPPASFQLQFVDLSRTSLIADDCAHVAALVVACPPLASLQLDGNAIGDGGCEVLATRLAMAPELVPHHLSLRRCSLGASACAALATLAHASPRLNSLNVSENRLGANGGAQLARAARMDERKRSRLSSISARSCSLRSGAAALAKIAVGLERLSLDLAGDKSDDDSDDEFDDPVAIRLAFLSALADSLRLQAQHSATAAASASAAAASAAAGAAPSMFTYLSSWWTTAAPPADVAPPTVVVDAGVASLRSLSISVTGLGGVGLSMLADSLKLNRTLTLLRISHSNLTDRCAQLLFTALAHHQCLRELDLSSNEIGDFGAQFVADVVASPALHVLTLTDNRIGAAGAGVIAEVVLKNARALQTLRLAGNPIEDGVARFADVVRQSKTLEFLDLRHINCAAVSWLALEKAVEQRDLRWGPLTIAY
jgi:Ran GTPase-activating protein (RanGAP) involved in mRNA processing and transport